MITVPLINWQPIGAMPDDRKDGRDILLADANTLGTAYGGDGEKLNPDYPWRYYIAEWDDRRWRTQESDRDGDSFYLEAEEPRYWADINPPE